MPTPTPTVPLALRLSPEQFRALDEKARALSLSRSEFVRRMIAECVATQDRKAHAA